MLEIIKKLFKKEEEKNLLKESFEEKMQSLFDSLGGDVVTILLGNDFAEMQDVISETAWNFREELKEESGFVMPVIHFLSKDELQENEIIVQVRGKKICQSFVIPSEKELKKELKKILNLIYDKYLDEIFTYEITEKYIDIARQSLYGTIWHLTAIYTVTEIRNVLIKLLENKKSIKNIVYVFEKFAECSLHSGFCEHRNPHKIAQDMCSML